jgi:hypothetical protein
MRLGDVDKLLYHKRKVMFFGLVPDDECWGFAVPVEEIDKAPTIDAVPVVRCRECKFYREFRTKRHNQLMRLCYRMGKHDMEYMVKPDDFCSYGQRKETDHEQ